MRVCSCTVAVVDACSCDCALIACVVVVGDRGVVSAQPGRREEKPAEEEDEETKTHDF